MRTYMMIAAGIGLAAMAGCGQPDNGAEGTESEVVESASGAEAVDATEPTQPEGELPQLVGKNLKVKPGLWEGEADSDGDITRSQYCVGESGFPMMDDFASSNEACQPQVSTAPGRLTMTTDCDQSGVNVKMKLDYQTSQTQADGDLTLTVTPPGGEPSTMTTTMKSRWIADSCPADLPPGETRLIDDEGDE
jgi:hypothetical protein